MSGSARGRKRTSAWLRSCGTVGKPDGNRENKHQPETLGETGLLTADLNLDSTRADLSGSGLEHCISDKRVTALGVTSKIFQLLVVVPFLYEISRRRLIDHNLTTSVPRGPAVCT